MRWSRRRLLWAGVAVAGPRLVGRLAYRRLPGPAALATPGARRRRSRAALRRHRGGAGGRGADGDRRADRPRALRGVLPLARRAPPRVPRGVRGIRAGRGPRRPRGGRAGIRRQPGVRQAGRARPGASRAWIRGRLGRGADGGSAGSPWPSYRRYILDEALALFARTDAWTALGYRGWPGQPRGLDRYRRTPA